MPNTYWAHLTQFFFISVVLVLASVFGNWPLVSQSVKEVLQSIRYHGCYSGDHPSLEHFFLTAL